MRIAVTRRIHDDQLDRLRDLGDVNLWNSDLPPSTDELCLLLEDATAVLTLLTDPVDGPLLDQIPSLKVVSNLAVGYDNIDIDAATERGVAVCTTPDVLTETTAEFTIALLFATARQVVPAARAAREGDWKTWYPMRFLGRDLEGQTIGIIGLGRIGSQVAKLATGLGMRVIYHDREPQDARYEYRSLDELLEESSVVSIHTPLTPATDGLIDEHALNMMKEDAILINTARGAVIETASLVAALEAGKLFAVGLDVTDPEPLPAEHPLYSFDRVTITPHIASASVATRWQMSKLAVDNIIAVLRGDEPPNCLNPEVLPVER